MMEINVWDWSGNLILVSEKYSSSVDYHFFTFAGSISSHSCCFYLIFFGEILGTACRGELDLIYGSAFATQLVLSVLCF
jgi:hypothetical protein